MDEIQVASYKMLSSLFFLGTDPSLTHDRYIQYIYIEIRYPCSGTHSNLQIKYLTHIFRKYLKTEIERHRPALGSCLGAFSSTFPVAFLEPHLNKHNQFSLLNRIADHSLEAQGKTYLLNRGLGRKVTKETTYSSIFKL